MRWMILLVFLLSWVSLSEAQRDAVKAAETVNVTKIPAPVLGTPLPRPEPMTVVVVQVQPDEEFQGVRGIGLVKIDVTHAPPYIRDAIRFLKSWGKKDQEELAKVSAPEVKVSVFGAAPVSLKEVRLQLPASGLAVLNKSPEQVIMRVKTLYLRDNGRLTRGHGELLMKSMGEGYQVQSVTVTR